MSGNTRCLSCGEPETEKDRELFALRRIVGLLLRRQQEPELQFVTLQLHMTEPVAVSFDGMGNVFLKMES